MSDDAARRAAWQFRAFVEADLPRLAVWLRLPHVQAWWPADGSPAALAAEYAPILRGEVAVRAHVALLDGAPSGYVQDYTPASLHGDGWWLDVADPGVRGIDIFVADQALLGRGLGARMIDAFVARLFQDRRVTLVQADPHPRNERAVRAFSRAGFCEQGPIRTPVGTALLMHRGR